MFPTASIMSIIAPIALIYLFILVISEYRKWKNKKEDVIVEEKTEKMIDKEEFLKEHDRKIAAHSEAQQPTRMERVSLHVERLSEKRKPITKVKETLVGEEVVKREVMHSTIKVNDMFTCRDDVIKGMIYSEILTKPKGLQ